MKKSTGIILGIIIGILVIIIGITAYIAVTNKQNANTEIEKLSEQVSTLEEKVINNNQTVKVDDNKDTSQEKTFKDVIGIYTYNQNLENANMPTYTLKLYENGTFWYNYGGTNYLLQGKMGNYLVDGDTVILNVWFNHGSDVGRYATNEEIKLKLNSNGEITDNVSRVTPKSASTSASNNIPNTVTLKRSASIDEKDKKEVNQDIMNTGYLENKQTKNN